MLLLVVLGVILTTQKNHAVTNASLEVELPEVKKEEDEEDEKKDEKTEENEVDVISASTQPVEVSVSVTVP